MNEYFLSELINGIKYKSSKETVIKMLNDEMSE